MAKYLHKRCTQAQWFMDRTYSMDGSAHLGVVVRHGVEPVAASPQNLAVPVINAIEKLGAAVGITMSSDITEALFELISPFQTEVRLSPTITVPVVDTVEDIGSGRASVRPGASICVCRRESYVLLWSQSVQNIIAHASDVEARLLALVSLRV